MGCYFCEIYLLLKHYNVSSVLATPYYPNMSIDRWIVLVFGNNRKTLVKYISNRIWEFHPTFAGNTYTMSYTRIYNSDNRKQCVLFVLIFTELLMCVGFRLTMRLKTH